MILIPEKKKQERDQGKDLEIEVMEVEEVVLVTSDQLPRTQMIDSRRRLFLKRMLNSR